MLTRQPVRGIAELGEREIGHADALHQSSVFVNAVDPVTANVFDASLIERLRKSGVKVLVKTVGAHESRLERSHTDIWDDNPRAVLRKIGDFHALAEEFSDDLAIVRNFQEVESAIRAGKIAILFHFQHPGPIGEYLTILRPYRDLGVRVMILAYNRRSLFADGCGESANAGLSVLGQSAVREMNRLGILIDLTHVGWRSAMETVELSNDPVVFTHSNPHALVDIPINIPDDLIRACAEKGGVIGICAMEVRFRKTGDVATVEHFLDHLDYAVSVAGVDHVGVGFDTTLHRTAAESERRAKRYPEVWGGYVKPTHVTGSVTGLHEPELWPNVTRGLVARGYSDDDIQKILGGNFMRVFQRVFRD